MYFNILIKYKVKSKINRNWWTIYIKNKDNYKEFYIKNKVDELLLLCGHHWDHHYPSSLFPMTSFSLSFSRCILPTGRVKGSLHAERLTSLGCSSIMEPSSSCMGNLVPAMPSSITWLGSTFYIIIFSCSTSSSTVWGAKTQNVQWESSLREIGLWKSYIFNINSKNKAYCKSICLWSKIREILLILVNNTFLKTCFNKAGMDSLALSIKIVSTQYHYYNHNYVHIGF